MHFLFSELAQKRQVEKRKRLFHFVEVCWALLSECLNLCLKLILDSVLLEHLHFGGFELHAQCSESFLQCCCLFGLPPSILDLEFFEVGIHLSDFLIGFLNVMLQAVNSALGFCLAFGWFGQFLRLHLGSHGTEARLISLHIFSGCFSLFILALPLPRQFLLCLCSPFETRIDVLQLLRSYWGVLKVFVFRIDLAFWKLPLVDSDILL